jgi:hypothetical protein
MRRTTSISILDPVDDTPIATPKLTFGKQKANAAFPTGGLFSRGIIKFDIKNISMVAVAREAFINNSEFKDDQNALSCFLSSLNVTSAFEGGFDSINTYDKAGISVGFLQFARPEGGVGKLLELVGRADLAKKVKLRFGTSDPHASPEALKARFDVDLLAEVVTAVATPAGIRAQMAMAINKNVDGQFYFDKAYARFVQLKLKDPICCNLLFDSAVNMGVGALSKFDPCSEGADADWLASSISFQKRPERKDGWNKILTTNFA